MNYKDVLEKKKQEVDKDKIECFKIPEKKSKVIAGDISAVVSQVKAPVRKEHNISGISKMAKKDETKFIDADALKGISDVSKKPEKKDFSYKGIAYTKERKVIRKIPRKKR